MAVRLLRRKVGDTVAYGHSLLGSIWISACFSLLRCKLSSGRFSYGLQLGPGSSHICKDRFQENREIDDVWYHEYKRDIKWISQ